MEAYLTIHDTFSAELTEKRSRFIATLAPCETEEGAAAFISAMRSKYWDARHNVFAYLLKDGTARFSDDGEPHGTAGKPILDVLVGSGLVNTVIVVTRYFGGVLLGTGGLVRAYSGAARLALEAAEVQEMCYCVSCSVNCPYPEYESLLKLIGAHNGTITNQEYTDSIKVEFCLKEESLEAFEADLCEKFSARLANNREGFLYNAFSLKK